MDSPIVSLYNEYVYGTMPRRVFLRRVADLADGTAAALALVKLLEPDYARGQQIPPDHPDLETSTVAYPGATGEVDGYLAKPRGLETEAPGILVTTRIAD